ncbi:MULTISPECIES: hypothetical protein [Kamptonema]|uniref:hypothetical protein n=1 Tax=Kamptonema TaxID=1501433 RepID=UPI00037D2B40
MVSVVDSLITAKGIAISGVKSYKNYAIGRNMTQLLMPYKKNAIKKKSAKFRWFDSTMALIALVDFSLVLFDFSYISWRDFYFRQFPAITQIYDPYKGIEPNRETQKYLNTVNALEAQILQTGTNSSEVSSLLEQLRSESVEMVNQNPFAVANKSGTLEKIKNRMRNRIPNPEDSSKEAFRRFWSSEYLNTRGWPQEIQWFKREITPLIATNYYRGIGENGEVIEQFWKIDRWFILIFGLEFIGRTFFLSRRYPGLTWREAMLWRWYDILLLLPFWRLLRVIPVIMRLNQAKLPDLEPLQTAITRLFVGSFAQELTEVVVIQIINQMQGAIRSGELAQQLFESQKQRYKDINDINEIETIATRLVQVTVYKVLPQLQPDLEALLRHSIESTLKQSPVYQGLQQVPGLGNLPEKLAEQLVGELSKLAAFGPQNAYEAFKAAADDPVGTQLSNQLVQHFGKALGSELQQQQTLQEIQLLLSDFLEEVKINYVKQLSEEDFQKILAETKQLHQANQR